MPAKKAKTVKKSNEIIPKNIENSTKAIKKVKKEEKQIVRRNLATDFYQCKGKIETAIEDFDEATYEGWTSQYLSTLFEPLPYFEERRAKSRPINASDLQKGYEYYIKLALIINQKARYLPNIYDFCKFVAVRVLIFNRHAEGKDEVSDTLNAIRDDLQGRITQSMMNGEIKEISGIFTAKASLKMKDSEAEVTNINILNTKKDIDEIMADFEKYMPGNIQD